MTQYMHVYGFKKRATSKMNRSTHTLNRLMSMLRVWLEAGKKQLRSSLEAGKRQSGVRLVPNEITSRRQRGYGSSLTRLRFVIITLLALMTFGATNALAQDNFSGTYYIGSNGWSNGSIDNYYLCPTEGWCYYKATDDFTSEANDTPFLTTYQVKKKAGYDKSKAIWIVEKHPTQDCYYIKNAVDGRYIVFNDKINTTTNEDRMRVHLDPSYTDNRALFRFTKNGNAYNIRPHEDYSNKWWTVNGGNKDALTGQSGKANGPTGYANTAGIIGVYKDIDGNSNFYLEPVIPLPSLSVNADGSVSIAKPEGTTIRYTLDGTTPTASNGATTLTVSASDIAGATGNAIQAIVVTSNNSESEVVSLPLKNYTYNILTKQSNATDVAIQHTIKQAVGKPFTNSYTDIPAAIRSPYLEKEKVKFFNNRDHRDEDEIHETPSATSDIYVTYTTDLLMQKFLHLGGARALNLKIDGDYIYDSGTEGSGTFEHKAEPTDSEKGSNQYFWFFSGNDPYAVEIKNAATNNIIGYATPSSSPTSLTLNTSPANSKFIIMATSGGGEFQQMELMAATGAATGDNTYYRVGYTEDAYNISTTATGDASLQIQAYPNSATITYKLIDQAGKILLNIETKSDAVDLPSDWQSPLVEKYNYWEVGAFDTYGTGDNTVYKLKAEPESWRINNITEAEGNVIYVTYEVNDKITFDISDDDKTHSGEYPTYMLKFHNGQEFNQENGTDGIENSPQKAEYPYSNGDAMLYIYSETKLNNQFASGASTRPRWLWYAVSPQAAKVNTGSEEEEVTPDYKGDPYHVKIMSYKDDVSSKASTSVKHHNFFRTYLVNYGGSDHVVTGLTTKHADVTDAAPTEYMVLSAPNSRYKLVTLNEIEGAPINGSYGTRQTVNTFEQYWKNNPTVQNILGDALKVDVTESATEDITLTSQQEERLPDGWHTYQKWAQAAPWKAWTEDGKTGKKYQNKHHWFQTIDMGSTGEFTFEAQSIDPEVILLDQHGWEIMRMPLSDAEALKKYDSPMVQEYQWYPTAAKVTGYHKYKVSDPTIIIYEPVVVSGKTKWQNSGETYTHTSTTLADSPYDHITPVQDESVQTDFYVTYTVKPEYANLYKGASTEGAVTPSAYMVKQGDKYAKISDSNTLTPTTENPYALESIGDEWHWYVKPNFNIDKEMGYKYDVDEDDGAGGTYTPNQSQKDALNYEEGRNGFDPYNIQIQSVKNDHYYFKTTTTGSQLNKGAWEGTSTDLSLKNMSAGRQENVDGYDQTKLSITNATFMVVKDASGHMLLMPRFDHTKVVNSFTDPYLSAPNAATQTLELIMAPKVIHSSSELVSMNGQYTLAEDFTFESGFTSLGSSDAPFTGSIDGMLHALGGLDNLKTPLIAYADGAIIKNIILDNVTVGNAKGENEEDIPNVGAIVANATGETRIYNCGINGGSVGGSGDVGGIVGNLHGEEITVDGKKKYIGARVINCYSYANVTSGTNVGGIVGNNDFASTASKIATMVMNCMFYGDITGGTNKSPIYGGTVIDNLQGGLNNFNYYAYEKLPTSHITSGKYNCALAVEDKFLNRFEFYRLLLNSNKKLAAFYATSSEATVNANDMMKWVLETADRSIATEDAKPYPVLKEQGYYPSIINYDVEHASDSATVGRNHGGKLGKTLSVTISGVGSNAPTGASIKTWSLTLTRTDKDFERFNFNYDKVQLPYYNDVGTGNYTENKVVTGWKITAITAVAGDPYNADNYPTSGIKDFPDHNYADRKSSNKDLYSVSKRVFSQGAYFDVPYGVESITIEPYWANAIYVADANYDVVYKNDYSGKQGVSQTGTQAVDNTTTFNGQKVRTSITGLGSGTTVYDNAVVLVGNFHLDGVPSGGTTPFTMMSVDEDNDHEPDYSLIYHHKGRTAICPIRFDFLNVIGTAQAQKPNGAKLICNFTIFKTRGWFEVTNTSSFYSSQLEYENLDNVTKSDAPLILLGGVVDQFVSTQSKTVTGKTIYIHVGGNVWIKEFGMGTHSDGQESTPHVPVSVTGGEFPGFYLTGTYNANAKVRTDNAECYISGGHFGEVAGASLEQIDGNVHWQIYNADIDNFFGGGINEAKPITGNVTTDIFNSHVTLFCGGPKFGNMAVDTKNPNNNKKVTTTAEGCTFGKFFGAGYGGTSIAKKKYYDKDGDQNWTTLQNYYATGDRGKYFDGASTGSSQTAGKDYGKKGLGVATDFDYEFFVWSTGTTGARLFVNFASFSLAQCNDVESNLKGCTINDAFYGGGSLGKVVGKATSVLDGCTVHGNVFGGGYSATLPTIQVRDGGFTQNPNYNSSSGMFEPGVFTGTTEFTWENAAKAGKTLTNGQSGSDLDNHYVYTNADLTALGQVKETDLTVKNNCLVEGGVYGGGDESAVNDNTLVKIENAGGSNKISNVYGGGNTADVDGNTEVHMMNGTVNHDIYGGGRGETTVVGGNVMVNIGGKTGEAPSITYSGTGLVEGNVYGGSALGDVNTTQNAETGEYDKITTVNVYGGTVNGSVFGGGLGQVAVAADPEHGIEAKTAIVAENQGNTTVNVEGGTVKTAVYGGSNVNGVLEKNDTVTIIGGTIGDPENQNRDVVFGGGYGAPTLVNGNVTVNVGTEGQTSAGATINGHVYGGGALGSTNGEWVTDDSTEPAITTFQPVAKTKTLVNLLKGTINGYAYGGGLGDAETAAYVGGDSVIVTLNGAKVKQVFGANNINGTPTGHVIVWVKRTVDHAKPTVDGSSNPLGREDRTPAEASGYDVEAVYGGGNEADYVPTKAIGTEEEKAEAFAEVLIEGCDKTSINAVYGGGNAAAVPATKVTVKGTYIINTLYGGGNGADPAKPGADVGIYKVGETPTNYGTGKAETKLLGGYINEVYGGSNTKGDVRGGTDVQTKGKTEVVTGDYCTKLDVGQIYGAGSHADVNGNVNIILECMPEDYVDAVYGGAEEATIDGNVTLTVTSGKFGRVFGGNNAGGNVKGTITVYVKEEGCQDLEIGELYGGGNLAPYSKYGCYYDAVNSKWKQYTTKSEENGNFEVEFDEHEQYPYHVKVFVESCTSIGSIFGGGRGATAEIMGDTYVNINMLKGIVNNTPKENLGKIGRVFGGGSAADVKGNTLVEIGTETASEPSGVIIADGTDFYINPDPEEYKTTPRVTISGSEAGIYGGGLSADVDGNTTLNIGTENLPLGTSITGNIYGGGLGETTHVTGNITVNIGEDAGEAPAHNYVGYAAITGDVYGGSAKGKVNSHLESSVETPTADAATKVNFYGGTINGNIYGGGEGQREAAALDHDIHYTQSECDAYNTEHSLTSGDAGFLTTESVKTPAHDAVPAIAADVYGPVTVTMEKGSTTNSIVDNVFGCNNFFGAPQDTVAVIINGGTINESVYGGGDEAEYTAPAGHKDYPAVYINNAAINENVFGGGYGLTAIVDGNPHITIGDKVEGHEVTILRSVYGGGELAGVHGNTNIKVNNGTIGTEGQGSAIYGNVYGGGFGTEDTSEMTEAQAVQEAGIVKGNTTVTINGGTILHNVYGGGANGSVGTFTYDANNFITGYTSGGLATVNILGGTIGTDGHENGMIFGSSRGDVGAPDAIQDKVAWVYDTQVTIGTSGHGTDAPEPQIKGSLYGGGENGHTYRNTSVTLYSGKVGITEELDSDPAGQKGAAYPYRGNVYGGGCGTDKYWVDANGNGNKEAEEYHYNAKAGIVNGTATVVINGGLVVRNLYGAGAMGSAVVGTNVTINGGTIGTDGAGGGYVYAAARGDEALTDADQAYVGNTSLTVAGGTIWNSAFGGGQSGIVKGSVDVTVSGGVVKNDVYGGGALANTNTDNWNTSTNNWSDATTATYYVEVKHLKRYDPNEPNEEKREAAMAAASGVDGYYEHPGDNTTTSDTKAKSGVTYYKKLDGFSTVAVNGTAKKTTVSLTGGTVGNAYGGGLGRLAKAAVVAVYTAVTDGTTLTKDKKYYTSDTGAGEFTSDGTEIADGTNYFELTTPASAAVPAIEAMVYGDISVTVDGTKFTKETERVDGKAIPVTGRVFGCNNLNGTPKGSVKVWVKQTKRLDDGSHVKNQFEIQGVYGGGNMSNYVPKTYDTDTEYGQHTQVIIDGCDKTSIERVYGGGNASDVPFTDVTIEGAFQIGYVFGGGNGGDKINKGTGAGWESNPGANVLPGYTNVVLHGGTIGEAFGGSDSLGDNGGTELTKDAKGDCTLVTNNIYGASKEAESDYDVTLNLSGCENSVVDKVFGGSYNADVRGSVTVNISSGIYTSVYGGNDRQGTIGGNITINVEEVDECNPIIIQNLVGGGSQADYPGVDSKGKPAKAYKGLPYPRGTTTNPDSYKDFTSGNITINVKAATRIDRIFGGCDNATATGTTTVNVNMVKGSKAGDEYTLPEGYTGNPIPNLVNGRIKDEIGTIGYIYGGGNEGDVIGNSVVNIGTEKDIAFTNFVNTSGTHSPTHLTPNDAGKYDVLGAHIEGNVYGGGNNGSVTGNTYVNICAKETATPGTYAAVAEGSDKVTIAGNVYGGGKGTADSFTCEKAMVGVAGDNDGTAYVNKGTDVHIGHGTIGGDVYGGGEIGRVEFDTKVTIGFGDGSSEAAKSPVIGGEVYGAGQGVPTHGYSGLTRGNSYVTIQGDSWVKKSVYGAGKVASLGRFNIAKTDEEAAAHGVEKGMPYELLSGGRSTVTIQGYAKVGPEAEMAMPTFLGNVFGAGQGALPYDVVGEPGRYYIDNSGNYTWESYANDSRETAYLKYIETLGITNNTVVTIGGNAFVQGSVYGGSMNGSVFAGTVVNISGGQIGRGSGKTGPYSSSD